MQRLVRGLCGAAAVIVLAMTAPAIAQIPFVQPLAPSGVNNAFPAQNPQGPTGAAFQVNYPYPGQCLADSKNSGLFPLLNTCLVAGSFACPANQTAGGWMDCGKLIPFKVPNPILANSAPVPLPAGTPAATQKFVWDVLNPNDYTPDTGTFPGADYYEIAVHEAWGFQQIANATLFPNPPVGPRVPNGMQWTGLLCNIVGGCTCPAGLVDPPSQPGFVAQYCPGGKVPNGAPLFTPIFGIGQINGWVGRAILGSPCSNNNNNNGCSPSAWSPPAPAGGGNDYYATWPSVSIRGTYGRPVVVKWVNEFPNNHVFCAHPEAADWPCPIDRTFMGVKARMDPALASASVPAEGVNQYGSPQQPDNSWVTHLHGGDIPPSTDGFAEKWFGNPVTAAAWATVGQRYLNPPFENPLSIALKRPAGNSDVYTYPMVNEEATIWFHDHTLGKTHHNVVAGPAGFFPVREPAKHGKVTGGICAAGQNCTYTWVDPVTEPRNALGQPLYDLFLAVQDRAFNDDGTINFTNGLGQVIPLGPLPVGYTPVTNGVNPQVHPTFVPEYFGDHVLVNGVLWPKNKTAPGWYRIRLVDGSDSRCWTAGFSTVLPAPGAKPKNDVPFWVLANDQGYLLRPVLAPGNQFTMCPGERYELLVNFGALPGFAAGAAAKIYMTNSAPAPFPAGITPYANGSPFAEMNVIMMFDVGTAAFPGVKSCGAAGNTWDPAFTQAQMASAIAAGTACMPANPALVPPLTANYAALPRPAPPYTGFTVRQMYLNERVDGVTQAPLGMQLNGVPFEYKVTETPKKGSTEVWQFINLTADAHPMHPHLVKHLILSRQNFNVGGYKALLCGSTTCQPGTTPGGEMQVVPDVTPLLWGGSVPVTAASVEGGFKDATQVPPGMVTTIIARWQGGWNASGSPNAPGTAGCPAGTPGCTAPYLFEDVTSGPFVWHCHINSHEDSEMMRTSLVVP